MHGLRFGAGALSVLTTGLWLAACGGPEPTFVDTSAGGGPRGGGAPTSTTSGTGGDDSCDLANCPTAAGATAVCDAGACALQCDAGRGDCDGDLSEPDTNGCEVDTQTSADHCGMCNRSCGEGCFEGECNGAIQVSAGWASVCAVRRNGSVYCWGKNEYGEAGNSENMPIHAPAKVNLEQAAIEVAVGGGFNSGHACAILADGTVSCWGNGALDGQPGSFNNGPSKVTGLVNVLQITAGGEHTCALKSDGVLFCWGNNAEGQLGNNSTNGTEIPVQVQTGVADVSAGGQHTCSVTTTGDVFCWGTNQFSQLALMMAEALVPTEVALDGVDEVSAGLQNSCARKGNELYCWGWDFNGGVGTGLCSGAVNTPQLLSLPDPQALSARGDESGVAIAGSDRHLEGWGLGVQIEDIDSVCGVDGSAVNGVAQVSHNKAVTCVLYETGELQCVGDDSDGAVGDGLDMGMTNKPLTPVTFPVD